MSSDDAEERTPTAHDVLHEVREQLPAIVEALEASKRTLAIIKGRTAEAEQTVDSTAMFIS